MKKIYVEPQTEYKDIIAETMIIGASDQSIWAESKERGFENYEEEEVFEDKTDFGNLW